MKYLIVLVAGILLVAVGCKKNDTIAPPPTQPVNPADTSLQKMLPFKVGAAVNVNLMQNNTRYNNLVKAEFNSITAENAMKFGTLHPGQFTYNWTQADYLVSFAQANNKRVHGHTLIWHQSIPDWVTNFAGDSTAWENLMKTHIQTVVTHYKGKVTSWDVVNEALNDDGTMRNSIWRQKLGDDYIARCFQYAHQADPTALLFYNDYGHEYSATKRTAINNLLVSLKNRNIPIHGTGMQFHTRYNQTDANIAAAINTAAATGLLVHVSELDIAMNPDNVQGLVFTATLAEQQAAKYKFVVRTFKNIPQAQQFGITTWNVTDGDSWIPTQYNRPDWPLPFDRNYARKPAYYGMLEGAK
ncbi:endo-1,4-beta-xylanase [Aridibaculum aurantiacum]|uniref:endo-1,4-beta-xylanase n=1 Tax=Aridibaculum aurantiacum TaxID=2810307 RepID=UPI001A962D23|nr:endo-1,4-beta-xylanase [Aridibaculum aurantiacum]